MRNRRESDGGARLRGLLGALALALPVVLGVASGLETTDRVVAAPAPYDVGSPTYADVERI